MKRLLFAGAIVAAPLQVDDIRKFCTKAPTTGLAIPGTVYFTDLGPDPYTCKFPAEALVVEGKGGTTGPTCTKMACGPQNPCCNACNATPTLDGSVVQVLLTGSLGACQGNSCKLECPGFKPRTQYRVTGVLRAEKDGNRIEINVTKVEAVTK